MWEKPSWDYNLYQRLNSQPTSKEPCQNTAVIPGSLASSCNDIKVKIPPRGTPELIPELQIILWLASATDPRKKKKRKAPRPKCYALILNKIPVSLWEFQSIHHSDSGYAYIK